jgi:hypothetical protein
MRYVIHIGPRKTGSTFLQETLYHLRDRLEKDGVLYPTGPFMLFQGASLHTRLFRMIRGEIAPDYEPEFARIRAAGYQTVVLSDEHFSEFTRPQIMKLRDAIGPADFEIIFYNRCWSERLPSNWIELVKAGWSLPFCDWLHTTLADAVNDKLVNSALTWEKWAHVFGRDAIRLVSYDSLREKKIDLAQHFFREIIGWQGDMTMNRKAAGNTSPPPIPTEICRALNFIDFRRNGRIVPGPRNDFISTVAKMDQARFEKVLGSELVTLPLSDESAIYADVMRQMEPWQDRVMPVGGEALLTSRKKKSFDYVRGNWTLRPDAPAMLRELYETVPLYKGVHQQQQQAAPQAARK